MQITKFPQMKISILQEKICLVADMLSRTFTKEQLQLNQLKHETTPTTNGIFAIMKNDEITPV